MKKRIFLFAVLVMIMTCLFVVSVNAETVIYEGQEIEIVNNLGDPSWYTGNTASTITDKNSVVILKDANGNLTAYPSYYVFRYLIDHSGVRLAWASDKGVDYSFINEMDNKSYVSGSIYYVELPYGITACTFANIWGKGKAEPNVVEIVLPDSVTTISYNGFSEMEHLEKITISKNIIVIDEWSFYNSKSLETVFFPEGCLLEKINKGSFNGCTNLSNVNLENCQSLITLGDSAFSGCLGLDKLSLPNSLKSIGFQALYNLGDFELESDYLPTSLTSVSDYFLSDCKLKNEVLYFPKGFSSLSSRYHFNGSFEPVTSLTLVFLGRMTNVNLSDTPLTNFLEKGSKKPLRLVFAQNTFSDTKDPVVSLVELNGKKGFVAISKDGTPLYSTNNEGTLSVKFENANYYNLTGVGNDVNGNVIYSASNSPTEIIFCGGDTVEVSYSIRCNHTDKGWYRFHTVGEQYDVETHITGEVHYDEINIESFANCGKDGVTTNTCIICDRKATVVVPATGKHSYKEDGDCTTSHFCSICENEVVKALEHNLLTKFQYLTFVENGTKTVACENVNCTYKVTMVAPAMFSCLGYSSSTFGDGGIAIGFTVNNEVMREYQAATGKIVTYGVFVVSQNKLGNNSVFAQDGAFANGVVGIEIKNREFSAFELKLVGFKDEQKNYLLAMGAYVKEALSDRFEHSYIQDDSKGQLIGDYYFVSYNDFYDK